MELFNANHPRFCNKICQECIESNINKYGTFDVECTGITVEEDVKLAMELEGVTEEEARFMFDPSYFFEVIYGSKPRWYQHRILKCTAKRVAGRQCRQTGKTLLFMYKIFHYLLTNDRKHVLVVVPTEKQIIKIWKEYVFRDFIDKSSEAKKSVSSSRMSPSYEVEFCNGSKLTISIANDSVRGSCLPPGTLITKANGEQTPIEEVKLGDELLTFDENKFKFKPNKVTDLIDNGPQECIKFKTRLGYELTATLNHPIWTQYGWTEAGDLTRDHFVAIPRENRTKFSIIDIKYDFIDHIENVGILPTLNLTVENTHTFIANNIVTHNTADWLYIDEAALIPSDSLNSILMTVSSREDNVIMYTSTPKGRGNAFYKACKEYTDHQEFHVSIYVVEEMKSQIPSFKIMLGETGFIQECEAEFPETSGGPFNYKGIDLAKADYEYTDCKKRPGMIYIGGVDWNGPGIGTYFSIIEFDAQNYRIKVVDKQIIASASWNSIAAKEMFIYLNNKWLPKHWMVDSGYGHCLKPNSKITTINGIKELKDIIIGEKVLTHDGSYQKVSKIFKPQVKKKLFKLTAGLHEPIEASEDHRFLIKRAGSDPIWVKVKDIDMRTDFFCELHKNNKYFYIPVLSKEYICETDDLLDIEVENSHSFVVSGLICHNSIIDELMYMSTFEVEGTNNALIKHTMQKIEFGSWTVFEDPFTREETKKMTKPFIVSQFARLFEIQNGKVPIIFSKHDNELIMSLENYKLLGTTEKGIEKYGFNKEDGVEDHMIDSIMLAVYAIFLHYGELFKRMCFLSVAFNNQGILNLKTEEQFDSKNPYKKPNGGLTLITDNNPKPIKLDENKLDLREKIEDNRFITRTFSKDGIKRNFGPKQIKRSNYVISRNIDLKG